MSADLAMWELDARRLAELIRSRLNRICADHLPQITDVQVSTPTEGDFVMALQSEGRLAMKPGEIVLHPDGNLAPLVLHVPMPWCGVFVLQSTDEEGLFRYYRNTLWTWCPWLAEGPGARFVRGNTHRQQTVFRIGAASGYFASLPITDEEGEILAEDQFWRRLIPPRPYLLIQEPDLLPGAVRDTILESARGLPVLLPPPRNTASKAAWRALREYALAIHSDKDGTDLDNIETAILMTYTFWLAARVVDQVFRVARLVRKPVSADESWHVILNDKQERPLGEPRLAVEAGLFPLKSLRKRGRLHAFRPINPVGAISQLTQVKRYDVKPDVIDNLPAVYHQNHPSFSGRLCPVETPESEALGVSLHLAKGASIDERGHIRPCSEDGHGLGWAASLIPVFEHNDAVRNMMGAKNLKQALPISGRSRPAVAGGEEDEVLDALAPLGKWGILADYFDKSGHLALGTDLLVAYMPFMGLNFEDAIVASRRLIDEGTLDCVREETLSFRIRPGLSTVPVESVSLNTNEGHLDSQGLARVGTRLHRGIALAQFWRPRSAEPYRILYDGLELADLLEITLDYDVAFGGRLACRIHKHFPLGPGDKLMGRHGNKGVISTLLPDDQMPRLPDSSALPEGLRGRAVDLLLNPHGVISRMNVGQLMETHLGWLMHVLPQDRIEALKFSTRPFALQYPKHIEAVSKALVCTGLDSGGRVQLVLSDGKRTEHPVVVGYQHIMRLRHIPCLKSQTRGHTEEARYDIRTGQAVHGRRVGGGQRVGEMELWALAAHQADHIISEMLYDKSDLRSFHTPISKTGVSSTWQAIRDYLFAMGISAELQNGRVHFGWAPMTTAAWSAGAVTGKADLIKGRTAVFECPRCQYSPIDRPIFYGRTESEEYAELGEVLLTLGWQCPGKPESWEASGAEKKGFPTYKGKWRLQGLEARRARLADVVCVEHKTDVSISIRIPQGRHKADILLAARGRKPSLGGSKGRMTRRGFTATSIGGLTDDADLRPIGELHVSCASQHPSVELRPVKGRSIKTAKPTEAGLFGAAVFGSGSSENMWSGRETWGHIELPEPISYPPEVFFGKSKKPDQATMAALPLIRHVPVLPLRYRAPLPGSYKDTDVPEINKKYRTLADLCQTASSLDETKDAGQRERRSLQAGIQTAVADVFADCLGALQGRIPKEGLIRKHGLGRRVDCSGRLVIVPDPDLRPSECMVPIHILWELASGEVTQWLKEAETFFLDKDAGRVATTEAFVQADRLATSVAGKRCDLHDRRFDILLKRLLDYRTAESLRAKSITTGEVETLCLRTLEAYLGAHRDKLVILNRQPSLHKYSMLAFRPIPTPMQDGEVLRISPLVCGAFGADFDGDEMALHWPLSAGAQQDAHTMLFRNNLLSEASGYPMAHYAQDIILGIYLLNKRGKEEDLFALLPDKDLVVKCCREILPSEPDRNDREILASKPDWNDKAGLALLRHICTEHPRQAEDTIWKLSLCSFRSVTEAGISFGLFDLTATQPSPGDLSAIIKGMDKEITRAKGDAKATVEALDRAGEAIGKTVMEQFRNVKQTEADALGFGQAAMAISGARGASQSRQLVAMRGHLAPGALGFEACPRDFFFQHSLVNGCSRRTYFQTAFNGRSSMCDKKLGTGKAGWLTRELVGAMWDVVVEAGDCGATGDRHPATCRLKGTVCQACYGKPPVNAVPYVDGKTGLYKAGYPAGLVAAQAIGERGTQLSMQSFHTGQRAFTPDAIRSLLDTPALFDIRTFMVEPAESLLEPRTSDLSKAVDELYGKLPGLQALHSELKDSERQAKARVRRRIRETIQRLLSDMELKGEAEHTLCNVFRELFRSIDAYKTLLPRHMQLLWRIIHDSEAKRLSKVAIELPPLAALGYSPIRQTLWRNTTEAIVDDLRHPASRIMLGHYEKEATEDA